VDVGQEIPAHLYRAVAEILAYIFKLMANSRGMGNTGKSRSGSGMNTVGL
jgi:flagellar biosynthesis protein FlhB